MFYIDLWGFTNDPLYLGYNSAGQENPVLRIFHFQGPIQSQIELGFWGRQYFITRSIWSTGTSREGHGGPNEGRWRA